MDVKADKPKRQWPAYLAIVLVPVLIGYPLSAGPADVIAYKLNNEAFNRVGREFYGPLLFVAEYTAMSGLLNDYLDFCHRVTNTPR